MEKLLVLVRHGKAQSRDLGLVDFERELTSAGKRALKAWLPKSRRLLAAEPVQTYELWASPSARTMQTAEMVAKVWGKSLDGFPQTPKSFEALWSGDREAAIELIAESSADALVVCGHNPFIEDVCSELTGCDISFATGGVAAIRLTISEEEMQARLMWFVQGPESRKWKRS